MKSSRWLVVVIVIVVIVIAVLNFGAIKGFFSSEDSGKEPSKQPENGPSAQKDGLALFKEGRFAEAQKLLEKEIAQPGKKDVGRRCDALGDCNDKSGNKMAAWYFYSMALAQADIKGEARNQAIKKASALGAELLFNGSVTPQNETISVTHLVQSGESLEKIAKTLGTTSGLLQKINNLPNPNMIRANSILRGIKGSFPRVVVDKGDFTLSAYYADPDGREYFLKQYRISTGQTGKETPLGTFTVGAKLVEPPWPDDKGKYHPYGDPLNPLGTRWMGFAEQGYTDLGIHGTIDEKSIGKKVTNGCVRMYNKDVEELYDMILPNAKIYIQE